MLRMKYPFYLSTKGGFYLGAIAVVDIEHTLINNDTIQTYHEKQMAIGAYTFFSTDPSYVNKLSETDQIKRIRELTDMNVDWIETDDPRQAKEILDSTP